MKSFYTDVSHKGDYVYFCGYENGIRVRDKVKYKPYLFISSNNHYSEYKTLQGKPVEKKTFDSIFEANNFKRKFSDVENVSLYGMDNWSYLFINDKYKEIDFDVSLMSIVVLDIETDSEGGYADLILADKAITAITLYKNDKSLTLGLKQYECKSENEIYIHCKSEEELLVKFIDIWNDDLWRPDVVTGWNIEQFDIPYLILRIARILIENEAKKISPWRILEEKKIEIFGKDTTVYFPMGIQVIDYLKLYKKFAPKKLEKYSLDFVSQFELGEGKLDWHNEYLSLDDLYKRNPQLYIEYNIKDTERVFALENKLGMIRQLITIAYMTKANFCDIFGTLRSWDTKIHSYLLEKKIVIPFTERSVGGDFVGGFVKDPKPGRYEYIASFDFTSLYPHIVMFLNISPETFRGMTEQFFTVDGILDGKKLHELNLVNRAKEKNYAISPNMCYYDKSKRGFLPILMEEVFNDRKKYKGKMLGLKKELVKLAKNSAEYNSMNEEIKRLSNMEQALKILINSLYGCVSNKYFRFFNLKNAEAITTCGQLAVRWVERYVNEYFNKILETKNIDYIIGIDTDSCYINLKPIIDKFNLNDVEKNKIIDAMDTFCEKNISKIIDKACNELMSYLNAYEQKLFMKREALVDVALWRAKKNYVLRVWDQEGIRYSEPEVKYVGIEVAKSNTPKICRDSLKKSIDFIMDGKKDDLLTHVAEFEKKFDFSDIDDISSPTGVNGITKYAGDDPGTYGFKTPRHVKGSIIYNMLLDNLKIADRYEKIHNGDKIKFISLKTPNRLGEDVIAFPGYLPKEFGIDDLIDRKAQFKKTFIEPLKTFAELVGWDVEQKGCLDDIFG